MNTNHTHTHPDGTTHSHPHNHYPHAHPHAGGYTTPVQTSTIYYTPSGPVEVPEGTTQMPVQMPPIEPIKMAPQWLVFPKHIVNTNNVTAIVKEDNDILFHCQAGAFKVQVADLDKTWTALQDVFEMGE